MHEKALDSASVTRRSLERERAHPAIAGFYFGFLQACFYIVLGVTHHAAFFGVVFGLIVWPVSMLVFVWFAKRRIFGERPDADRDPLPTLPVDSSAARPTASVFWIMMVGVLMIGDSVMSLAGSQRSIGRMIMLLLFVWIVSSALREAQDAEHGGLTCAP